MNAHAPLGPPLPRKPATPPPPEWVPLPHNPGVERNTNDGKLRTRDIPAAARAPGAPFIVPDHERGIVWDDEYDEFLP